MWDPKDCPHCGGKSFVMMVEGSWYTKYSVYCGSCGIKTIEYDNRQKAVDIWNGKRK